MLSPAIKPPELSKYELLEEIGHGGMATVYRARDVRLERDVAVKLLHKHLRDSNEVRTRFASEARAVAKLKHANIVEVFDVSDEDDEERELLLDRDDDELTDDADDAGDEDDRELLLGCEDDAALDEPPPPVPPVVPPVPPVPPLPPVVPLPPVPPPSHAHGHTAPATRSQVNTCEPPGPLWCSTQL